MCEMGDLTGWVEHKTREDMASAFRVPSENENGRKVTD